MPRERVIGSYLVRVTEDGRGARVRLQDLRRGSTLEFETWVAAWAYVDARLMADASDADASDGDGSDGDASDGDGDPPGSTRCRGSP